MDDKHIDIVYLVTTGEYSDYIIIGVFTDEKVVDKVIEEHNKDCSEYDKYMKESWEVDVGIEHLRKGLYPFEGRMNINDSSGAYARVYLETFGIEKKLYIHGDYLRFKNVYAKDSIHALKIVNEIRARYLAMGKLE